MANLYGMHLARYFKCNQIKHGGNAVAGASADAGRGASQLVALVSADSHYSYKKGAHLMGLGTDHCIPIATNRAGDMDLAALESALQSSLARGQIPFFLGATAGTTVMGAFDPIPRLRGICTRYGLWLHVDGAWGGAVFLSPTHRERLLPGIETVDSFCWNPHKLLGAPLQCSMFLVNGHHPTAPPSPVVAPAAAAPAAAVGIHHQLDSSCNNNNQNPQHPSPSLAQSQQFQQQFQQQQQQSARGLLYDCNNCRAPYCFQADKMYTEEDIGDMTISCSRKPDAFKLWLMWKALGERGLARRVDHALSLAEYTVSLLKNASSSSGGGGSGGSGNGGTRTTTTTTTTTAVVVSNGDNDVSAVTSPPPANGKKRTLHMMNDDLPPPSMGFQGRFVLAHDPVYCNVCFWYVPPCLDALTTEDIAAVMAVPIASIPATATAAAASTTAEVVVGGDASTGTSAAKHYSTYLTPIEDPWELQADDPRARLLARVVPYIKTQMQKRGMALITFTGKWNFFRLVFASPLHMGKDNVDTVFRDIDTVGATISLQDLLPKS